MTSSPARSRIVLACLASFCFSAALLTAQSDTPVQSASPAQLKPAEAPPLPQEPEPSITIRQTVQRVIVDVMVRDADGKPVHGLKPDDFSITEDKQPQRVLSFAHIHTSGVGVATPAQMAQLGEQAAFFQTQHKN